MIPDFAPVRICCNIYIVSRIENVLIRHIYLVKMSSLDTRKRRKKHMKLIVGNWKMNGLTADSRDRAAQLAAAVSNAGSYAFKMVLCPPATQISTTVAAIDGSPVECGGQDCHAEKSGAFTGNISAEMLRDAGCKYVILGHSERRQHHAEKDADVAAKAVAAHAAGLVTIICVGETDAERSAGKQNDIVGAQLKGSIPACATADNTVIAYEPVWAIGTGKTASAQDVLDMHAFIREQAPAFRILYGGSVKGANAAEILGTPNVDGVLVGGASLKVDDFMQIASAS
jgi:triosephosphate isomerase